MQLLKAKNRPLPALALYLFCLGCFTVYIGAAAVNYTHGNGALETLFVCVFGWCLMLLASFGCYRTVALQLSRAKEETAKMDLNEGKRKA